MSRRRASLLLILGIVSCGRADKADPNLRGASSAPADSSPAATTGEWPTDLASALVIPADTENLAVVLHPAPSPAAAPATEFILFGPNGATIQRTATATPDSAHCGDAPMTRLGRASRSGWSLGLGAAKAKSIETDSLDNLSHEDSVFYSVEGARLASIVAAGVQSRLAGLQFSLAALRRLRVGDTTIIAAQLVRRVNQEANPAEERTLVIAERAGSGPFTTLHAARSEGTEETAAHHDLIGAFRAGAILYLVISTDSPAGVTVEILERASGAWRVRWTRTIAC